MRLRNREPRRLERPNSKATLGLLVWMSVPFLLLWCVIRVSAELGENLILPRSQTFAGELRSEYEVFPVTLRQGLALKEVVVSEGDQVSAGQTLAVLDREQIALREEEISAELTALDVLLACLRAQDDVGAGSDFVARSELEITVQDTLRECRLFRGSQNQEAGQIRSEIALLEEQRNLLQHKIKLSPSLENSQDFGRLEELVSAAMASTKLDERILKLRGRLQELQRQTEEETLTKLKQAKVAMRELEDEKRRLSEALATPRIVAQVSGRVARIRNLPEGFQAQQDTQLTVLRPGNQGGYVMTFSFPIGQSQQIGLGAKVRATVSGWAGPGAGPELRGQVTGFLPQARNQASNHLIAEVTLDAASVQAIESAGFRLALNGPGMASLLTVSLQEETLRESIERIVARDFGDGDGVIHRVVEELGGMSLAF